MSELVENLRNTGNGMIGLSHDAQHLIDQRDEARKDRDEALAERDEISAAFASVRDHRDHLDDLLYRLKAEQHSYPLRVVTGMDTLPRVITADELEYGQFIVYRTDSFGWFPVEFVGDPVNSLAQNADTIVLLADAPEPETEKVPALPTEPGAVIEVVAAEGDALKKPILAHFDGESWSPLGSPLFQMDKGFHTDLLPDDITSWRPMRVVPADD